MRKKLDTRYIGLIDSLPYFDQAALLQTDASSLTACTLDPEILQEI